MAVRNICKYALNRKFYTNYSLLEKDAWTVNSKKIYLSSKANFSSGRRKTTRFVSSNLGLIAAGIGAGALVGGSYSVYKQTQASRPVLNDAEKERLPLLSKLPDNPVSRQVISPVDNTNLKLVLYQYPTCPFCCKVRAFLDYYGFSYDVIEVDPVLRQQTSWSQYKKVPILLANVDKGYQQLNDSTLIISALKSFLHDREGNNLTRLIHFYPTVDYNDEQGNQKSEIMNKYFLMYQGAGPKGSTNELIIDERKWRKWADDVLVHTLSPNVYRTWDEALQAFKWFSEVGEWDRLFPAWERVTVVYTGALAMWGISKRLKKRYHLKEDVRQSLYDECNIWVREVKKKGQFHGGSAPDLADLAVYGVLSSIEGCIAFQDLLQNTKIGTWYSDVKVCVKNHKGSSEMSR